MNAATNADIANLQAQIDALKTQFAALEQRQTTQASSIQAVQTTATAAVVAARSGGGGSRGIA
jgi:prefoldin subunit 5